MHIVFCGPVTFRDFSRLLACPTNLPPEKYGLTTDIVKAYLSRMHRITIVSWSREIHNTCSWENENLTIIAVPMRNLSTGLLKLTREMTRQIKKARPDVVHAHWLYEYADAALASGLPALITAHDSPWRIAKLLNTPYWWYRAIYAQLRIIPRTRTLSTLSPYMLDEMRNRCHYRHRLELIPNGIPIAQITDKGRTHRLHDENINLMVTSNWQALKNIPVSLQAFAYVKETFPRARLILVGKGLGLNEEAHKYALSRDQTAGVEFKGPCSRSQIYTLLREKIDIYLHTSREEACCMAILEAMSQGVPCVAGKASGAVPWMLDYGNAGVLADIELPQAVADGIFLLLKENNKYTQISTTALERAKTVFSFENAITKYIELLENISREGS